MLAVPVRILVTGATGFAGSHLVEYLLREVSDVQIYALKRWRSPMDNCASFEDDDRVRWIEGDLTDYASIDGALDLPGGDFDFVFHLAAQSLVPYSNRAKAATVEANTIGTLNLLEYLRVWECSCRIHVCSSSEVYGQVPPDRLPIREDCPMNPVSPYAVSKAAADHFASMYHKAYGLKTIRTRAFTHSGPRRGIPFFDSWFCYQIARIEAGKQPPEIRVGNLDAVRTVCDVRDLVAAYWAIVRRGTPGEVYNVGGVETYTVSEVLRMVLGLAKPGIAVSVRVDPTLIRPADVTTQRPDCTKLCAATGWRPTIPYSQTLRDMLAYWRQRVGEGRS